MNSRHSMIAVAASMLLFTSLTAADAQTAGPVLTPIAPGPNLPTTGFGAIGPGNTPIAPGRLGPAAPSVEEVGPGGTLLAPGPADNVPGSPTLDTPAIPGGRVR